MTNIYKRFAGSECIGNDEDRKMDDEASNLMPVAIVHPPVAGMAVPFLVLSSQHTMKWCHLSQD